MGIVGNIAKVGLLLVCFSHLFVTFSSCSSRHEKPEEVMAFPVTGSLKSTVSSIPKPILLPRYMGAMDDYFFVYKEREDSLFAFFRLDNGRYVHDAGTRGQGPDEFNLLDTRSFDTTCGGNEFRVMEAGSNLLKRVRYEGGKLSVVGSDAVFAQGVSNNGFYPLADSMYLTLGRLEGDAEYGLFNGRTGEYTETGEYPEWFKVERKADTPPPFVPYLKTCVVHPSGQKIAAFYMRFKRFRIYDHALNLLHDVDVKIPPCSINFDDPVQQQPVYYVGQPYATERYIYILCANSGTDAGVHELQVWDWDGKPVACYALDRKPTMMVVSPKYAKIYALDHRVCDELYTYELPFIE